VAEFVEVGNATDLQDGAMKEVSIGGRNLLIARAGENYYAAENR